MNNALKNTCTTFLIAVLSLVFLAGCAGETAQKKAEQETARGEERKAEILKLLGDLEAEGISFGSNAQDEDPAIELMKEADLKKNQPKLDRLVVAIGEYVAFINRDDVKVTGTSKEELRSALSAIGVKAGKHLRYANKRMAKLQSAKSKKAVKNTENKAG